MTKKILNAFAFNAKQIPLFANNANWETIKKNKFFTGNYTHFNSPRTELEATRYAMTRTWNLNTREYLK